MKRVLLLTGDGGEGCEASYAIHRPGEAGHSPAVADLSAVDFDAVLVLGGRVPEYLRHNTHVLRLVGEFTQRNKWLFAICHGIPVFNAAGVVAGRKGTAQTWESHPEFYREVMACLAS